MTYDGLGHYSKVVTTIKETIHLVAQIDAAIPIWLIEVFFPALKQNLRVKSFVGISANALKIQIWTALIALLLLKYLQLLAGWRRPCGSVVFEYAPFPAQT